MAWTTPRTYVAGEVVTAAILNTDHRDNLNALAAITGIIPASGTTATAGTGFTYTHTNGTGVYAFTFSPAFAATPVVVANVVDASAAAPTCHVSGRSASTATVNVHDNVNAALDQPFNFRAFVVV